MLTVVRKVFEDHKGHLLGLLQQLPTGPGASSGAPALPRLASSIGARPPPKPIAALPATLGPSLFLSFSALDTGRSMSRTSLRLALARSRGALAGPSSTLLALTSSAARRSSSSSSGSLPPSGTYKVFDRDNVRHHRELAYGKDGGERSRTVGYLREEIGERVMERFEVRLRLAASPLLLAISAAAARHRLATTWRPLALRLTEGPVCGSLPLPGRQAPAVRPQQPRCAAAAARSA
jgi:hypothetical protein